jgi:acyl-CoA synthetase (AMP-forming)/AMP-acid ligase II
MKSISPDLLEKIRHARSLEAIPHDHSIVPCATIGELLQMRVEEHEGEPFLIFYEDEGHRQELSYREFYEEVCRTANYFSASGIRQGSRIGVVSTNHTDTVVAYFAGFLLGGVIVPISTEEEDRRISHILSHSGVEMLLVRAQFVDRILRLLPPSQVKIACTGQRIRADLPYAPAEIARQPSTLTAPSGGSRDDEALLVFTSGTGGPPRGVVLTHYNLLVDAMAIAEWHVLSPDQRMMCVLPLHHVNGIVVTLLTPLFAGCGVVLNQKFHANRFFERISAERVSLASVVPTLLQFLLHSSLDMEAYKLASFRHLVCGAGPLTVELAQKFEQTFKIPIIHGYGLSEATCYASFLPLDLNHAMHKQWLTKHGFPSIGVPLPVNEMEIHDPDGKPQEEGARGEMKDFTSRMMKGGSSSSSRGESRS